MTSTMDQQEDLFAQIMSHMSAAQSDAKKNPEQLIKSAQMSQRGVTDFQVEVSKDCKDIQDKIVQLRSKIERNIEGQVNQKGLLRGHVNEYIEEVFDAQIVKLNAKLEIDIKYWADQAHEVNSKAQ